MIEINGFDFHFLSALRPYCHFGLHRLTTSQALAHATPACSESAAGPESATVLSTKTLA